MSFGASSGSVGGNFPPNSCIFHMQKLHGYIRLSTYSIVAHGLRYSKKIPPKKQTPQKSLRLNCDDSRSCAFVTHLQYRRHVLESSCLSVLSSSDTTKCEAPIDRHSLYAKQIEREDGETESQCAEATFPVSDTGDFYRGSSLGRP